jgi:hypothetical protein
MGICLSVAPSRFAQKTANSPGSLKSSGGFSSAQGGESGAPKPAPEIQSLTKALAGRWITQEKYEPIFMTPTGGAGHGEQVFRPGPGGFVLTEEYHSKTPAGELFGFGVIWWDQSKGLQHLWCINVYPTGCELFPPPPQPGPQWDGKQLVLHLEGDQDGKKLVWQEVISDITPNSFTQSADISDSGGPLKRWFTTHAVRATVPTHP